MQRGRTRTSPDHRLALLVVAILSIGLTACTDDGNGDRDATTATTGTTGATDTSPPTDEDGGGEDGGGDDDAAEDSDPSWTERAAAPLPATEVGAAWFDGQIWVIGGFAEDASPLDAVQVYDPGEDSWATAAPLPVRVHHATVVATDDSLLVIGGYQGAGFGEATDEVWVLTDSGVWSEGPQLPAPRGAGAGAWDGARVVFGGGVGPDGLSADVWALSGDEWVAVGELSEARDHLGAASDGQGRVWFLGGRFGSLRSNRATVDLVENDQVTSIGTLPTARGGVAGFHAPGIGACLAGGEEPDGTFADVECIDANGDTTTLASLGHPRHGLGAVAAGGVAYTMLGGPEPGLAVSDVVEVLALG